jgi:hypothetical protein
MGKMKEACTMVSYLHAENEDNVPDEDKLHKVVPTTAEKLEAVTKLTSKVDQVNADCFDREIFHTYKVSISQCLKN